MLRFWNTFLSFQDVLWLHLAMFRSLRAALGMDGPQADFGGTLWSTTSLLLKMAQYIVDLPKHGGSFHRFLLVRLPEAVLTMT